MLSVKGHNKHSVCTETPTALRGKCSSQNDLFLLLYVFVPLKSLCSQFQVNTIKILFKILFLINLVCLELAMIVPMPKSRVLKILHFKHLNAALPLLTYRF